MKKKYNRHMKGALSPSINSKTKPLSLISSEVGRACSQMLLYHLSRVRKTINLSELAVPLNKSMTVAGPPGAFSVTASWHIQNVPGGADVGAATDHACGMRSEA